MDNPAPDLIAILSLIEQARADMIRTLDTLTAAVRASQAAPAAAPQRRTIYRGGAIVPTDLDRAKARAALARMGIRR